MKNYQGNRKKYKRKENSTKESSWKREDDRNGIYSTKRSTYNKLWKKNGKKES